MQPSVHAPPREGDAANAAGALRTILVVDGEEEQRQRLTILLKQSGYEPTAVGTAEAAQAELSRGAFDAVLCDVGMPRLSGRELAEAISAWNAGSTLILLCGADKLEHALEMAQLGAYAVLQMPLRAEELSVVLRNAEERVRLFRENQSLRRGLAERTRGPTDDDRNLIGDSPSMQELRRTIQKIAEHKTTVLITGESGTGKELVARAIHAASPRREGPFVAVNCGAIPETLLESELFGHKKGAFTDASRDKRGLFSEASGGTLFLDELGEMPLQPQVKLLRVLQEQRVRPLGGIEDEAVDVRVVAATPRDLAADVAAGRFREDLFYRLNVIQVALPALRDRRDDLPRLVDHFLARTNHKLGTRVTRVAPETLQLLSAYPWPGNIRELENTIERSVVLCEGDVLTVEGLPERFHERRDPVRAALSTGELSIKKTVRIIEEELIRRALQVTRGNRTNAAKQLEISHRALLYKMKEYGVKDPPVGATKNMPGEKFDGEG